MATTPEHDLLICLFHHTDRAERTVQELLEIGVPESAITLIGHVRKTVDIETDAATLGSVNVPEADRQRLSDGLRAGGSIVAVSTDSSMAGKIEEIFKEYSADKIDDKMMSTSDLNPLGEGAPADFADNLRSSSTGTDRYANEQIDKVLLVSDPATGLMGSPEIVTTEETLILLEPTDLGKLEPTDLVEDTDLVEPRGRSGTSSGVTGRFDPDAPIDNVRNPAADPLNAPLNRR